MRIVTRGDLDGLACAVLLAEREEPEALVLAHPQDLIHGRVEVKPGDVVANLPYHPACARWFDHRVSTPADPAPPRGFPGLYREAPSATQLVWEHLGRPARWRTLVEETNRLDAGWLEESEVVDPRGYILLGFTLDGRTGLGAFHHYFKSCFRWLQEETIDDVLARPLVQTRVQRIEEEQTAFREVLQQCSRIDGKVVVSDLRRQLVPPVGNRFLVYTLFREARYALRLHWGPRREFVVASAGRSILHRDGRVNLARLMSRWGGGGHAGVASTPLGLDTVEGAIEEIVAELNEVA